MCNPYPELGVVLSWLVDAPLYLRPMRFWPANEDEGVVAKAMPFVDDVLPLSPRSTNDEEDDPCCSPISCLCFDGSSDWSNWSAWLLKFSEKFQNALKKFIEQLFY